MQTKIGVVIHKNGFNNGKIIERLGEHNGNLCEFTQKNLTGLLTLQMIDYPATNRLLIYVDDGEDTIHISEDDGKTFTLTLTWKEVEELKDDIPKYLFVSGSSETEKEIIREIDRKTVS